jgi:hypothetical protein
MDTILRTTIIIHIMVMATVTAEAEEPATAFTGIITLVIQAVEHTIAADCQTDLLRRIIVR